MCGNSRFTSENYPKRDQIRAVISDDYDGRVLVRSGNGRKSILHTPQNSHEPLCELTTHDGTWLEKSLAVFPPGHKDWCKRCLTRMSLELDLDSDRPATKNQ